MRIAVVGTGSIGQRHLRTLLGLGESELLAVSEHGRRDRLTIDGVDVPVVHDRADALGDAGLVVVPGVGVASAAAGLRDRRAGTCG